MTKAMITEELANTPEHFFDADGNALFRSQSEIEDYLVRLWEREYPDQHKLFPRYYNWSLIEVEVSQLKARRPRNQKRAERYMQLMEEGTRFPH